MKVSINWNETYLKTSPKLLGICRRYIKDVATAEDIVQDSFIVAIQKQETLKDVNAVNGWLSKIVINMAIHHIKNNKKIVFSNSENFEIIDNYTTMNTIELDNKSRLLASDLDRNDVLEAIDSLPDHHKSVFNMYVIDRFSHNEIAKVLEISVGTSKSHLSRARKSIQAFLLDKINSKPDDKEKKRWIAFLLFLGLENSMFGNLYRKSFQDFEIQPQKDVSFSSKDVSFPKHFIGLDKTISYSKIIFGSIGIVLFISIVVYFNNYSKKETISNEKQEVSKVNSNENLIVIQNVVSKKDSLRSDITETKSKKITTKSNLEKNLSKQKKSVLISKNPIVKITKDSTTNEPKKVVVIKKQIIIKDTVYVTK